MPHSLKGTKLNTISSRIVPVLIAIVSLAGCGGGGGGSGGGSSNGNPHASPTSSGTTPQPAHLAWQSPTRNVDGSCADDIAAYRISYGPTTGGYYTHTEIASLSGGDVLCGQTDYDAQCGLPVLSCSFTTSDLQPGTWHFAVQAIDNQGYQSDYSGEVSKEIY